MPDGGVGVSNGPTARKGQLMRPLKVVLAVVSITLTLMTSRAMGQTTRQAPPAPPVTAGWQDGFVLQSANGENRLVLGLTVQADGRFLFGDTQTLADTFTIRKARPTFSGRIAKYFDFRIMPDFGAGIATLQDAYIDVRFSPMFRVRTGKDKTPIGYELLQGDPYLLFPERSLASNLVPNRDVGVQAQGDLSPRFTYSGGVFNGIPGGANSSTDIDTNGSKDVAGRIVWQPFRSTTTPVGRLSGLGFHLGGSIGDQQGALPTYRTVSLQPFFAYAGGVTASGSQTRITPAVFYYFKSVGAFAEYMKSTQDVGRSGSTVAIGNQGWEVTGSYVLTGEPASDRGVRLHHSFDPANHVWGALQVAARYSAVRIDPEAFANGLVASTANQKADAFAVAANWYPNAFIKYYVTFERTWLEGGAPDRRENVLTFRAQVAF
jgi:phosphate-selective porin OprO and OprP